MLLSSPIITMDNRPSKKGSVATPVLLLKDEFFVVTGVTTLRGMRFLDSLIIEHNNYARSAVCLEKGKPGGIEGRKPTGPSLEVSGVTWLPMAEVVTCGYSLMKRGFQRSTRVGW